MMNFTNLEIRSLLWKKGIKQYELAKMLGMTEFSLSRKLREELPDEEKKKIISVIEECDRT